MQDFIVEKRENLPQKKKINLDQILNFFDLRFFFFLKLYVKLIVLSLLRGRREEDLKTVQENAPI